LTIEEIQKMPQTDFKNKPIQEVANLILNSIPVESGASTKPVLSEKKERTAQEIGELADILQPYQQTMTAAALSEMVAAIQQNNLTNCEIADFARVFQTFQNSMK